MYVGGEPYVRDPFLPPVVFEHTANKEISIGLQGDINIVEPDLLRSEITGNLDVIKLSPRNPGTTSIKVIATDACFDYQVTTTFNVTVNDTTTN